MKNMMVIGLFGLATVAAGQTIEHDDVYFNAKDRAQLRAAQMAKAPVATAPREREMPLTASRYASRNLNPEYTAQPVANTAGTAESDNQDYFTSGYRPTHVNQNLSNNIYGPDAFYSPFYGNNFWNPYNSFYDPWGWNSWNTWNRFSPGWSFSFGYSNWGSWGWRNSWNFGWGNTWGSPFWSGGWYNDPWCWNNWGWRGGFNSGWNAWGYPRQIVVIDNGSRPSRVYQKRSDRSSTTNQVVDNTRPANSYSRGGRDITPGGRTRSTESTTSSDYYDRGWRRSSESTTTRSYWSNGSQSSTSTQRNSSPSYNWGDTNSGRTRSGSTWESSPSRSNWSSGSSGGSYGGGSRSSGSSGSSGSRSRGRD
jgi:hypothetical protein